MPVSVFFVKVIVPRHATGTKRVTAKTVEERDGNTRSFSSSPTSVIESHFASEKSDLFDKQRFFIIMGA